MVSLFKQDKIRTFEYFYFFVMVLYMAQIDSNTSRMIGTLSPPYFPFFLPIILTIVLLDRNKVRFNDKRLIKITLTFAIWTILLFAHKRTYGSDQYSYYFFLFYSIIIAYIHIQVFGRKICTLYEHIMVRLCLISLILWGIAVLYPGSASFFRNFPETATGRNVLYVFKWLDSTIREQDIVNNGILRNAGCSWEPGRFAIMVLLALYCNLTRCGIKFKGNISGVILLLAMISTQSTTGYVGTIVLYSFFALKKFDLKYILAFCIFVVPISYQFLQLNFMQEKIEEQLDIDDDLIRINKSMDYVNKVKESNEYTGSLARFPSMYFEIINIEHDPILGYGKNVGKSYFSQRISGNYLLTGGLLKIFGQYGIPLGLILYLILLQSSRALGRELNVRKSALFVIMLISLTSYSFFTSPIFMAFWFYGLFRKEDSMLVSATEEGEEIIEDKASEEIDSQIKE